MTVSREKLLVESKATGYRPEVLEKVIYLLNLLEGLRSHPFLRDRLALKGGTALNLERATVRDIDAAPYPGVTDIDAYGSFGGEAGLNIQVGKYIRFRATAPTTSMSSSVAEMSPATTRRSRCI